MSRTDIPHDAVFGRIRCNVVFLVCADGFVWEKDLVANGLHVLSYFEKHEVVTVKNGSGDLPQTRLRRLLSRILARPPSVDAHRESDVRLVPNLALIVSSPLAGSSPVRREEESVNAQDGGLPPEGL
jgi:hypothetical protein